jgi:XTP/dITP diphosphohydrolase
VRLVLVSTNRHKLAELSAALPEWTIELLEPALEVEERGETFAENARAKAHAGRAAGDPAAWVVAEDSGLEVDALGGNPGVRSARYAAPGEDPIAKLLAELRAVAERDRRRSARYVCEMVAVSPAGEEIRSRGTLQGSIGDAPRGGEGFGFDPVFVPEGHDRTVAELGNDWKRRKSHRARAAAALRDALRGHVPL